MWPYNLRQGQDVIGQGQDLKAKAKDKKSALWPRQGLTSPSCLVPLTAVVVHKKHTECPLKPYNYGVVN